MAQERPFYDALMQFAGVTDTSQPLSLDARAKIGAELTDLARVAANLTTDRERSAVKSYIAERKREFDLAKTRADLIQELRVLDKNLAADRAKTALTVREKAAKYIAETENKLYRPDMARVQGKLLGAQGAMDLLQRLVGDPILESTEGVLSKDETVYARLRRFGQQYPTYFRLEGSKVIPGAQLGTVNQATVQALKDRVAQTYDAFRLLEESVARSKAVEAEMERIQRDADAEVEQSIINPAVASLGDVQLRAQPKQIGEDIRRAREELEKGDRELARIDRAEKTLRGMLENADQDAVRAAFAKAVNNPFFQQWAESNGFDIGTSDGTAGSYRAGRDDVEAAALFALQERTGMRLSKRRGRTVALPEEFMDVSAPLTEDQEYMSSVLAEGGEDKPEEVFVISSEGKPPRYIVKDMRPESGSKAYLELLPDGKVARITDEQMNIEDESLKLEVLDPRNPESVPAFALALGNMNKSRKESTRRGGQVYTEVRLTPEDLRQRRRRLLDEETGEVIEVPLDTKLDVLEDIRVPLTRKIGQRADERFFARQKRKADRELLREEELPRPPERTDMEEEAVPDVEGLPSVDEQLEEELVGGFDIVAEDGRVDLDQTRGKRAREVALQRAAEMRTERIREQDEPAGPVTRTREDELKEEFDARVAAGMSRKKAAKEAVKAVEAREAAGERRLPTEAERQKAREGMPGVTADPTAIPRFAGTERAAKRPGRGDVSLGRPMPSALDFKQDGLDISYDPESKAFSFERGGKAYRFEPGSEDPAAAGIYESLQEGLRREKPGIFFTGFPTIDATLPGDLPAASTAASEPESETRVEKLRKMRDKLRMQGQTRLPLSPRETALMDVVEASPRVIGARTDPETFEYIEGGDQDAAREALKSEEQRKQIVGKLQERFKKQKGQQSDTAQEGE